MVLDYDKEPKDLLILATADARINVKRGRISLKVCDLEMEFGMDCSEFPKPISSINSSTNTSPQNAQNPQTEANATLPSAQLAIESCRDLVSIYTTPPVD